MSTAKISDWDIDELKWLENLKRETMEINLIIEGNPEFKISMKNLVFIS